ncbi:MAG TPA: hypothetical protein DDZ89_03340 [Clostridiales bacterium]|nr:hypothetical protein [Clostridiales bacterium]
MMKLGIIGKFGDNEIFNEDVFRSAHDKGLEFLEFCINVGRDVNLFTSKTEQLKEFLIKYDLKVGSVGRWGTERLNAKGKPNEDALKDDKALIKWCNEIGCGVFVTGCNYVEELSLYENCTAAIGYFEELIRYGKENNVKIAVYNCNWNNFVHSDPIWDIILGYLKDLYIKYDPSHCVYAGGDYLAEAKKWGKRFAHVHIKGALTVDEERFDDPPAGLDEIKWGSFMSILYAHGYDGNLSIEPHSATWRGELGNKGVDFTIRFIRNLMM